MTRYDEFYEKFDENPEKFKDKARGNGSFEYNTQVEELSKLSNKLNMSLFIYMFGDTLGEHLMYKFHKNDRNLLSFFNGLDENYKFFMLWELKTNKELFAYC
jgi:hypothetical protein